MERIIKITQGNINNGHIYLSKIIDIFPKECVGGSNAKSAGKEITLNVYGVGEIITDIAGDKKIFRNRSWAKSFFRNNKIVNDDSVCIKKIDKFTFNLSPSSNKANEQTSDTNTIPQSDQKTAEINSDPNSYYGDKSYEQIKIPSSGLVIAEPWISKILSGKKTWEMRGKHTKKFETIALIKKGSGTIVGTARIIDSIGPFDRNEMVANTYKHQIPEQMIRSGEVDKWNHAWVLDEITAYEKPMPYNHPSGAVTWVTLK